MQSALKRYFDSVVVKRIATLWRLLALIMTSRVISRHLLVSSGRKYF